MAFPFDRLKARLLANPKVKAEYDALAPEFENCRGADQGPSPCWTIARRVRHQSINHCPIGEWPNAAEHEDVSTVR